MTKNYCDHCNKEVRNDNYIKISFMGNTKTFLYKQTCFCEKCFIKIDKEINKFIPNRLKTKTT